MEYNKKRKMHTHINDSSSVSIPLQSSGIVPPSPVLLPRLLMSTCYVKKKKKKCAQMKAHK
jgi:hypothetical protein